MKTINWKVLAIVFMVLFALETLFVGSVMYWAVGDVDLEYECAYNVCAEEESYYYYDGLCVCYIGDQAVKTEYLK